MPVINCWNSDENKPGYKVENTGGCPHTYSPGDKTSREEARKKAEKQLIAIKISQNESNKT